MNELNEIYNSLNSEDKTKVLNYAKHLQNRNNDKNIRKSNPNGNNERLNNDYSYLNGLSESTKKFVIETVEKENLNLWHSVNAIIDGGKYSSIEEAVTYYYNKYSKNRDYLVDKKDLILELFEMINLKRVKKKKKHI